MIRISNLNVFTLRHLIRKNAVHAEVTGRQCETYVITYWHTMYYMKYAQFPRFRVFVTVCYLSILTHCGRVTHISVDNLTINGSDNGLSPGRRQAITWTNIGILLIGPLGTNFSEILIEIHTFSFGEIHLKTSSGKWRPFCLGLNVLPATIRITSQASGKL